MVWFGWWCVNRRTGGGKVTHCSICLVSSTIINAPAAAPAGYAAAPQQLGPGPPIQTTKNSHGKPPLQATQPLNTDTPHSLTAPSPPPAFITGPPGCNLFIFHVPNDLTNQDLYNLFVNFGNVISTRIMVDLETGRSRGFGGLHNAPSASLWIY